MSLLTVYLEQLRRYPPPVRHQLALGLSFLLTGIIFLIWLSVFRLNNAPPPAAEPVSAGWLAQAAKRLERGWQALF